MSLRAAADAGLGGGASAPLMPAASAVALVAPVPPALSPMSVDAAGVALGAGVLRRFGGTHYRAPLSTDLYASNNGALAVLFDRQVQAVNHLTLREAASNRLLWQHDVQRAWPRPYAVSADAKKLVHGKKDAQLIDTASGAVLARRAGLSPPYVFAGRWVVGLRNKQLVAWRPDSGEVRVLATLSGSIYKLHSAAAAPVVAAIENKRTKGPKGYTDHNAVWLF